MDPEQTNASRQEAPETPQPITIRERLETISLYSAEAAVHALQGLILLRIAESLERLESILRPAARLPLGVPIPAAPTVRESQRCPKCSGLGYTGWLQDLGGPDDGAWCDCQIGRDLARQRKDYHGA